MTKEEVLFIMNNLYVGCKVLYDDFTFGSHSSLKTGTIVEIEEHESYTDPICIDCIGYIRIKGDNGEFTTLGCMVGEDEGRYGFRIREIIMDDFLKKEEFIL